MKREDVMFGEYNIEGAQYVIVAFGTVSRIVDSRHRHTREQGFESRHATPHHALPFPDKAMHGSRNAIG